MFWRAVICAHAGLVPTHCQSGTVDGWGREVFDLVQGLNFCESQWRGFQMGSAGKGLFQTGAKASPGLTGRFIPAGKPGKEPSPHLVPVLPNSGPRS